LRFRHRFSYFIVLPTVLESQRFYILHCLVLDGVYLNRDGVAIFHEAAAPTVEELEALLAKISRVPCAH